MNKGKGREFFFYIVELEFLFIEIVDYEFFGEVKVLSGNKAKVFFDLLIFVIY